VSDAAAGAWPGAVTALTLFVDDLAAAKRFYVEVFGAPILVEDAESVAFRFPNTIVNLLVATSAPELIEPEPVAPAAAGARMQLTITVDDVDAVARMVQERGAVLLNGPQDRPWGIRTAAFRDPSGHVWEIADSGTGT
jgi:catechol 2,3-dioxygenase-like lactoylglutathione lyase family enzyme